jgi:hypothetical protein
MQKAGHESYAGKFCWILYRLRHLLIIPNKILVLGAKGDFLPIRDAALAEATKAYDEDLALPEEVRRSRPKPEPDMNARFPMEPFLQWLYTYDATAVAKEYLAQLK